MTGAGNPDRGSGEQVGLAFEDGSGDRDPVRAADGVKRLAAQPALAERGDPQVRATDEVADGPVHGGFDGDVRREAGEQHRHAEGDADDRQEGPAGASAEAAPGDPVHRARARAGRVAR